MNNITFINFNGIQEYARVMYNDVKDADKYRIDVAYNGRDIKDLLEYLFNLEQEISRLKNIIKEVREEVRIYEEQSKDGATNELDNYVFIQRLKNVLNKGDD